MKQNFNISSSEKISLVSNLSTLLSAGIPILETVDSLIEDSKGDQKKILEVLRNDLTQGKHLYESFSQFPQVFDKVTLNIIKAAEGAGTLDITLKDLKISIKKEMEFTDKIRSALLYPIIILMVFLGVLLMILLVVIPKISTVFLRLKVELPLPTRVLIFISEALINNTIVTVLILGVVSTMTVILFKRQHRLFINLFIALPLVSGLSKEIDLTRFTRSLSLLLNAGIPITTALNLAVDVILRKDIITTVRETREMVITGKRLSEGFRKHKGVIPMIMVKITEAGEKSGSLEKSMQEISEYLDYQVSKSLQTAMTLVEPIMLVCVGALVGAMMMAIIAPIYGLIGQIGAR